jgi:hypothetical protein
MVVKIGTLYVKIVNISDDLKQDFTNGILITFLYGQIPYHHMPSQKF